MLARIAWKSLNTEHDDTSRYRSSPGAQASRSNFLYWAKPMSPVHIDSTWYRRPNRRRMSSASATSFSNSSIDDSAVVTLTSSTLENSCMRMNPRVSEPAAIAEQEGETRSRHPGRPLEVHDAERLAQVVVGPRREVEIRLVPPLPRDHVVLLGLTDRHRFVEEIWDLQEQEVELMFHRVRQLERGLRFLGH